MSYGDFVRRSVTLITIIIITFFLVVAIVELSGILLLVFTCWVLSVGLHHLILRFRRLGLSKGLAVSATLASVLVSLILIVFVVVPPFISQGRNLINSLPDAVQQLVESYDNFRNDTPEVGQYLPEFTVEDYNSLFATTLDEVLGDEGGNRENTRNISLNFGRIVQSALPVLGGIGSFVGSVLANFTFIVLITSYLLFDPLVYYRPIVALVPKSRELRVVEIINKIQAAVIGWMGALSVSIAFTTTSIIVVHGLILGIPNVVALGVIAGLASFIPNVGYYIGLFPILLFTAVVDPVKIIPAGILYWLVNEIDGKLISPNVIKNQLNIPAGIVFPFQLIAAASLGFFGIILAVPILAILVILWRELYVYDTLGKRDHNVELVENEKGQVTLIMPEEPPDPVTPGAQPA